MYKKVFIKTVFFILCMFISTNVYAECTTKELNNLKQEAYNVKFNYEYVEGSYGESEFAVFSIRATNLSENIKVKYGSRYYTYNEDRTMPSVASINGIFTDNNTYIFEIYASSNTSCEDTFIASKKVNTPDFNEYSVREECENYSEYDYCQRWYSGKIASEEDFLARIEEYKTGKVEALGSEEEQSAFEKFINWINDNLIIIIPSAILIVGIITYIIVSYVTKKRKRVRIKI